ncbi:MAG TPA: YCF48-related protein [Pyrinomonadaceae bacterium]|nr:YCF48-related protein [Pyrinomonadaceae bacterium]
MKTNRLLRRLYAFALLTALFASAHTVTVSADGPESDGEATMQRPLSWAVTGPMGGDVRSLAIDPQDPERLYFGTIDGQIYSSTDGGQTWARLGGFNRPGLYIDNLIVDPRDSRVIYAAAHRHKEPGGFFKTKDGGLTWREASELKAEAVHALTQAAKNPDVLVAGTNRGVFRSEDGGDSWEHLETAATPGLVNVESLAVDPRNTDVIYAGTWYLPYKTTDGGETWNITKNGIIDDSDIFAIEIDETNPDHVIMSACSGIYETRNAGALWRKVNGIPSQSRRTRAILQNPAVPSAIYAGTTEGFWLSQNGGNDWRVTTNRQNFEINAIAVHPQNPSTVYIGTNNYGVMVSRDGGKNFAPSNEGYSGRRAYFILPDREVAGRVYATTINTATGGGYFYLSEDGGETWRLSTRNMPHRLISYAILQDRQDANVIYLGTNYGMYRSADRGVSWSPITPPKPKPTKRRGRGGAAATKAQVSPDERALTKRAQEALNLAGYDTGTPDGVAGTRTVAAIRKFQADKSIPQSGKLDSTTLTALGLGGGMQSGGGASQALQSAPVFLTDNVTVNALAHFYDEREGKTGMLAATNAGLYRTYDPSVGWDKVSYGATFDAEPRTLCISTSAQNSKTVYVGTAKLGVLASHDAGKTWEQLRGIPTDAPVNVIEQDPRRSDYVYVGTTQTFYISHDGGERWLRRGGNLPLGSFTSVLINPANTDEVFVGNAYERGGRAFTTGEGGGVFRSTDAGMTWQRVDPQLPSRRVWALAFDPRDSSKLFVGSHSAGVFVARRDAATAEK